MLTFAHFNRNTLKLLVAAVLVLGGASMPTARAQDVSDPSLGLRGVVLDPPTSPMSAQTLAAHPTCVIYADGRRALVQGAVIQYGQPIEGTSATVQVADRQGHGERQEVTTGDGGFFSLDVSAPRDASAAFVTSGTQLLGMGVCTHPNISPAPGLGMGGVAISNAIPAAQTAANVQRSADAYNLF